MTLSRRRFLSATAAATAYLSAPYILRGADAGRKYRTALIGSGWWGKNILKEGLASGRCKVTSLCDVDSANLEVSADQIAALSGDDPKTYQDYRELLEKDKPEVVIVATPDHWHALTTIAALKAGAHVFVEKPTGHTVNESRAMLRASQQAERLVQVGLHRRIGPHHVSAMKFLRSGAVGKVGMVRLFVHGGGTGPEKPTPNSAPPDGMDWNMWCGPAPLRPFNTKLHPGGWRNFLDYANGTIGDWGVHWLDQVMWWSGEKYPKRVFSTAGRPIRGAAILNDREQTTDTPDHQTATFEFQDFTCVWENRAFAGNDAEKHKLGAYFYGTKGTLHIGWRDGWTFYPTSSNEKQVHEDAQLQQPDGHNIKLLWADFIEAIEIRRPGVADIGLAHRSSVLPMLAQVSCKVGRSLEWDADKELVINDPQANALLSRPYRAPWVYPAI
ncbi:Gfo/Idh/MocA family protein [Humisphaera borealis]|uniref:Gfo/Idh/MocA family oxidoreductase n=1 Tax=Humisphaera borealis TaxID=2807512 RepID=A0A7M2X037_9BACT|nr:Gfo/Idh/MocA family oxidoreductase [Humisphaera borealis]QOV91106.1 Gfo/Idh/MocA family oxidoreductase [Humisphaera borealis]